MRRFKVMVAGLLARLTANAAGQKMLARLVFYSNYLMGVGAGAQASASGESGALRNILLSAGEAPVIFDVGANRGQFLRLVLDETSLISPQIHCFEPSKDAFACLAAEFQKYGNVRLNHFGLAETGGSATLYYDTTASGLASLTKRRLDHFGISHDSSEQVILETVDGYCEENGLEEITVLKIDVEGHELDVLRGASNMFGRRAVSAVMFEFGGCNIDTRTFFQDYWYFFTDIGMNIYRVTPTGQVFHIKKYAEVHEQFVTTNFVAIRE